MKFVLLSVFVFAIIVIGLNFERIRSFFVNSLFSKKKGIEKFLYTCPRCGSTHVKSNFIMSPVELARPGARKMKELGYSRYKRAVGTVFVLGFVIAPFWQPTNPQVYICLDCDYYGICPEVDEDKIEEFKKKIDEEKMKKIK